MHPSDHQLLLGMHKGHEPSALLLWERLGRRLIAYARSLLRDEQAAEDAVQGALLRVMQASRSQVAAVSDVTAWLVTLTRREAATQVRTHRRDVARQAGAGRPEREPGPSAPHELLASALAALPRRQREVLVLKHIAGLTFDQIALALALNRNTAAARYRSGVAMLRKSLTDSPARDEVESHDEPSSAHAGYTLREVHHE